jgi:hypothetical protein
MSAMKFSLRTLLHFVTVACVAFFWVGAVVRHTPVQVVAIGLTAIGIPYCYFVFRNSRGSLVGRTARTVFFGFGWFWVANYLAVLSATCSPRGRGLDALDGALAFAACVTLFPLTVVIIVLLLRAYFWAFHDAEFESQIND